MAAKRKRATARKTPTVEGTATGNIKKGDRVYIPEVQQHGTVTHLVREKGKGVTAQAESDNGFRWHGKVEHLVTSATETSVSTGAADETEVVEVNG